MVRKCCFCKTTASKNIKLHRFPAIDEAKQAWLDAIPIKMRAYRTSVLCSRHFSNNDYRLGKFGKPYLSGNAIPSVFLLSDLNLPSKNTDSDTTSDSDKSSVAETSLKTEPTIAATTVNFETITSCPDMGNMYSLKGKSLEEKSMVMLMNVLDYFHRTTDINETTLVERTADACGVSVATVYRTKARFKAAEQAGTALSVPRKKFNPQETSKSVDIQDFSKQSDENYIENCVEDVLVKEEITEYEVTDFPKNPGSCLADVANFVKVEPLTVSVIKQEV